MLLVIDNYDSFTYNLVHFLGDVGGTCVVRRNDQITVDEALAMKPAGIVLSPGPCTPNEAGICLDLIKEAGPKIPLLGVCLGHQAIALACGSKVGRTNPIHGKIATVRHDGTGLFKGLPSPFAATRYHSLAVPDPQSPLVANAWSEDGTVMAMRHSHAPVHGIQFHPESVASEQGKALLSAFLDICHAAA